MFIITCSWLKKSCWSKETLWTSVSLKFVSSDLKKFQKILSSDSIDFYFSFNIIFQLTNCHETLFLLLSPALCCQTSAGCCFPRFWSVMILSRCYSTVSLASFSTYYLFTFLLPASKYFFFLLLTPYFFFRKNHFWLVYPQAVYRLFIWASAKFGLHLASAVKLLPVLVKIRDL